MSTSNPQSPAQPSVTNWESSTPALLFSILAGPSAWTAHLLLGYLFVTAACTDGLTDLGIFLHALTVVTILITIAGGILGWRAWTQAKRAQATDQEGHLARVQFMGLAGVLMSALFLFAIIVADIPSFFLPMCH